MSSRYLAFADILGRICICVYFMLAMVRRVYHSSRIVSKDIWTDQDVMTLISSAAAVLFLGMICVVTVTRLPPIKSANGIEPYLTAMVGTFIIGLIGYLPEPADLPLSIQIAATTLIVIGMGTSVYVLAWLGRAFSIMPEARTLITGGPYSIVRHPLYLTEEIAMIGFIMHSLSVWSVLLGILQWMLQLRRMTNEEHVLRSAFPDYDTYSGMVPRVIPISPR